MNINEARAWKRNRYGYDHVFGAPSSGEHVMMKPEAKVMRRLQAETGLSEEEIRSHKKYRKMLSDAQKNPEGSSDAKRAAKRLLKGVTRELKLAKAHPDVVKAAMDAAKNAERRGFLRWTPRGVVSAMRDLLGK